MSVRGIFFQIAFKAGLLFGALFLVSVLLAAIPSHRPPSAAQEPATTQVQSAMPRMAMSGDERVNEKAAVHDMTQDRHDAHSLHSPDEGVAPQRSSRE
jgi:hypothetical protein